MTYEQIKKEMIKSLLGTVDEVPYCPGDRNPYMYLTMQVWGDPAAIIAGLPYWGTMAARWVGHTPSINVIFHAQDRAHMVLALSRPLTAVEIAAHRAAVTAAEEARTAVDGKIL